MRYQLISSCDLLPSYLNPWACFKQQPLHHCSRLCVQAKCKTKGVHGREATGATGTQSRPLPDLACKTWPQNTDAATNTALQQPLYATARGRPAAACAVMSAGIQTRQAQALLALDGIHIDRLVTGGSVGVARPDDACAAACGLPGTAAEWPQPADPSPLTSCPFCWPASSSTAQQSAQAGVGAGQRASLTMHQDSWPERQCRFDRSECII